MSSLLSAELVATCNALGYFEPQQNKYYADANTLETVKDLIRYLRRDDETFDIRRQLGETKVVQTDLLPLLKNYWQETDLFDVLLRLLVNLTTPALMLWQEELPSERTARNQYLQIEEHLRLYKQAFADEAVWAVLSTRLSKILEIDQPERSDEDGLIIERMLILIRNVLYVPADPDAEKRPDNDASVHDQVLWALHQSGMLDIVLYMTSSTNEQAYYMHILEMLSYMLREQSATELANAALQRSETEKMRDEAELLAIRHRENNRKHQKAKQYTGTRHSRFGGTFVVKSMKSISDNELIYHKPLNKLDALNFDVDKTKPKTPRNRMPVKGENFERRSAFSIRLFLKEFCVEFLNGAYNALMYHVKDRLARARAQQHDESYYLWALRFFMEFNRCYKFEVKLVSETMSVQTFHFVQQQMENYFDMINSDKKKIRLWSRRLHLALLAYRELLLTICAMDKSPDGTVRDSSKVIKSNIFYIIEYRELVLTLLVTFDELKMSAPYLKDLLETQHVFLKMLEGHCGGKAGRLVVQAKGKRRRKKKGNVTAAAAPVPGFNLEDMWDEVSPQLSAVLEGGMIPGDVVPFDAGSDVPIDEQKSEAMRNIQRKLRAHEFEVAVGLLRASREVWPENDDFGTANMAAEEEFLALRDVFFADLGENHPPQQQAPEPQEDEYEEDEEDELEESMQIQESDLKFDEFVVRMAHPRIVRACGLALRNFELNTILTNHCIVKLLHRIAFDCKMSAMVFQLSIFRTFQKIFESKGLPQYKELVKFATYIMREFFKAAQENQHIFMEALFWKSKADAYEVVEGYGTYHQKSKAAAKAWTELEEDELRKLYMEHSEKQIEEDVIDWIVNNLIDNTKNRRSVLKKLKEMYLLENYRPRKSGGVTAKIPKEWGSEEEEQLQELYGQFKDAMDPLTCIMERLDVRRPKNRIAEKLMVMGLVQERKELWKKRARKSQMGRGRADEDSDDSGGGDGGIGRGSSRNNAATTSNPRPGKSRKTKGSKSSGHVRISSGDLAKMLISLADGDMAEALGWIKENFDDALEDFDEDPSEDETGIPIVAILDHAVTAMESPEFLNLLRALGLNEPDDQGIYWRIPPTLTASTLKSHCELITKALDKTLTLEETPVATPLQIEESSDEDVFEKLKRFTSNSEKSDKTEAKDVFEEVIKEKTDSKEDRISRLLKKTAKSKQRQKFELEILSKPKSDRRRIQIDDSSEEEMDVPRDEGDKMSLMPHRISDTDSDDGVVRRVRDVLGRSDSDNDASFSKNKFRSMKVIISDDEDTSATNKQTKTKKRGIESDEEDVEEVAVIRSDNEDGGINKRTKRKKRNIERDEEAVIGSDNEHDTNATNKRTKKKKQSLESDEEDEVPVIGSENEDDTNETNKRTKKKKQSLESDEEDEVAVIGSDYEHDTNATNKRTKNKKQLIESDEEAVIGSDNEDDKNATNKRTQKKKQSIESDEEDAVAVIGSDNEDDTKATNKKTKKKKQNIESDEENEVPVIRRGNIDVINATNKKPKKKKQNIESDEEDEEITHGLRGRVLKNTVEDEASSDSEDASRSKKNRSIGTDEENSTEANKFGNEGSSKATTKTKRHNKKKTFQDSNEDSNDAASFTKDNKIDAQDSLVMIKKKIRKTISIDEDSVDSQVSNDGSESKATNNDKIIDAQDSMVMIKKKLRKVANLPSDDEGEDESQQVTEDESQQVNEKESWQVTENELQQITEVSLISKIVEKNLKKVASLPDDEDELQQFNDDKSQQVPEDESEQVTKDSVRSKIVKRKVANLPSEDEGEDESHQVTEDESEKVSLGIKKDSIDGTLKKKTRITKSVDDAKISSVLNDDSNDALVKPRKRASKFNLLNSDDSNDASPNEEKAQITEDEDSEINKENIRRNSNVEVGDVENKRTLSDSDTERPKAKKSRFILSDEED